MAALTLTLGAMLLPPDLAVAVISTEIPRSDVWVASSRVWSIIEQGDYVYLGGNFGALGPNTGHGVLVDASSGALLPGSPRINGLVHDAVSDGAGGYYVVGAFNAVNGVSRGRGVHILADGSLGPFELAANGTVTEIARLGDNLVIGGDFTSIRGLPRENLALVKPGGSPAPEWRAIPVNGPVDEIVVSPDGQRVFVGGSFSMVNQAPRLNVASLAATDGAVEDWAPALNGGLQAIAIDGDRVYLGGSFTSAGLVPRQRLAAVDYGMGVVDLTWAADANGEVRALTVLGGHLYAGGAFTKVDGVTRNRAAALTSDGTVTAWNPNASAAVNALAPSTDGSRVYLAGAFTTVKFKPRGRLAAVDPVTGALAGSLDPRAMNQIRTIVPGPDGLFLGGDFPSVGIVNQRYLARLHRASGSLDTSFRPVLDGRVETMDLSADGATLYLGGRFTSVNGSTRNRAAAVNVPAGTLTAYNPDVNGVAVQAIDHRNGKVALGGQFTLVSGLPLRNAALTNASSGTADPGWAPNPDKQVRDVDIVADGDVILGGDFTTVGLLTSRPYLARIDAVSGLATSWQPNPSNLVYEGVLNASETHYYAAILGPGGGGGNKIEKFTTAGANNLQWSVTLNGDVQALDLSPDGQTVYAGGHFSLVFEGDTTTVQATRDRMLAVQSSDGALLAWAPDLDLSGDGVFAVHATTNGIYIGGDFTRVGPSSTRSLAVFPGTP